MSTKHDSPCLEKAGDDEPIFVIRAQDKLSVPTLEAWINYAKLWGVSEGKVQKAEETLESIKQWQAEHGAKLPD